MKGPHKVILQFENLKIFNFYSSKMYVVKMIETISRERLKPFSSRICGLLARGHCFIFLFIKQALTEH